MMSWSLVAGHKLKREIHRNRFDSTREATIKSRGQKGTKPGCQERPDEPSVGYTRTMTKGLGRYPWFWTGLIAIVVYFDLRALNGGWVYDDAGSVVKNVVVNGMVDWKEAFSRDFWGTEMKEAQSHKSFRPITTLTLKANYVFGLKFREYQHGNATTANDNKQNLPPTWSFHALNVALHGIVTALVTKATAFVLPPEDVVSQLVVGSIFAVHPVHAEVVSNITSRGELLMSIFFLIAFLSYAGTLKKSQASNSDTGFGLQRLCGIYVVPWLCMTLSLFSKEQGATTLISLVAWDFLKHHGNLKELGRKVFATYRQTDANANANANATEGADADGKPEVAIGVSKHERDKAWQFLGRTLALAVQTLIVVGWRYKLNGETSPDFIEAQNPAGFAKDRFTRVFSVTWVYCLYVRDALYPYYLSPDWSGRSIDLITSLKDPRAMGVIALWYLSAQSFWTMVMGAETIHDDVGNNNKNSQETKILFSPNESSVPKWSWNESTLRQVNIAVWAFTFSPFLLSSNILVVVGLMKGDRVIYLPLFGFCLIEALLIRKFRNGAVTMRPSFERRKEQLFWGAHFFLMFQLIVFSGKVHDRNLAWSDSLRLWESAYAVNPRSYHTMYNYGYELSLKQRYIESEVVMRPIGSARVDGPSNTFVYTMVLFNLKQCDLANVLLDEAFQVIDERRQEGGPRNTDSHLSRTESNLLVAKAHCTDDPSEKGKVMYRAVEKDPTNDYAVQLATNYMQQLQQLEQRQKQSAK